jgi:hypothetical protein
VFAIYASAAMTDHLIDRISVLHLGLRVDRSAMPLDLPDGFLPASSRGMARQRPVHEQAQALIAPDLDHDGALRRALGLQILQF